MNDLIKQNIDFFIGMPDEFTKVSNYVMASNGVFYVRHTKMGNLIMDVPNGKVPGLKTIVPGLDLTIPKIPFEMICQTLSFFKKVYDNDKSEASALIFWDPDIKEHFFYIPEQSNSTAQSDFKDDKEVIRLRAEKVPVMEIHSHHTMEAFWSGTDNSNENMPQCYMVFGTITKTPTYKVRFCCGDIKTDISIWDIIKAPDITMTVGKQVITFGIPAVWTEFPALDFPVEWMDQLKKSVTTWSSHGKLPTVYEGYGRGPIVYDSNRIIPGSYATEWESKYAKKR